MSNSLRTSLPPAPTVRAITGPESVPPSWRHSSFSRGVDMTCVDVAFAPGEVSVRDSKDPDGPVLRFTPREWEVFLLGVRNDEFDALRAR
ncbi:hypothetical protein FAIPA1_10258 [Frankia sp. AiPs1]|uniref:DUF397 domain-containing protein n=1 Tax=Frankia sp. AiPa1 TaxID=573492 RepID=UPI00202B9197|nr:DUF397 domain-containing protein [Frankia sp. AiPa1]MCL9759875.1 DUF397 domain-containing protein [Frankia sp. AiPa1]